MGWLILVIGALLYVSSWYIHPLRSCPSCKGTPRKYGGLHRSKFRWCSHCEGRGRVPRIGAVVLMKMGLMKHGAERTGSIGWMRKNRSR